jgi:hypothetical protein
MTRRATLRASDADRELVAERLREAATEGRLFADELEERLGAALSARTYGELDALVADLPAPPSRALARPPAEAGRIRPVVAVAVALPLALMLIGVIAFAVAGHPGRGDAGGLRGGAPLIWLVWIALAWRFLTRRRRGTR